VEKNEMGYATIVSLEAFKQAHERSGIRQQLHEHFDRWLDRVEERVKGKPPTLEQMTEAVFVLRQELTGRVTEVLVEEAHRDTLAQQTLPCPHCSRRLHAQGPHPRTVETRVGPVRLSRPYFYCLCCQEGFYPLDDALQLAERRKQWDLQKASARLVAEVPYETASELFETLTGLSFSDHIAHEVVGEVSDGLTVLSVSPTAEQIRQKIAPVAQGKGWRPIVVLAIDGAAVPTRPETAKGGRPGRKHKRAKRARWQGQWREAKGFRFYLVDRERIVHLLSWHQVQSDEELAEALQQVQAAGLIPEGQVRLGVIADGAKWIWTHVQALFPSAVQILDYYHCSEHLHRVAAAQFADSPAHQTEWVEAIVARLFCGEVEDILDGLQHMETRDPHVTEEIRKLIGYLTNHQQRVDYGFARKAGYPIGSGGIESANKFISHVRLKRSGAWWYVEKANEMLALRCAKYNGTFDSIFEAYKQRGKPGAGKTFT
jgi:Uncharacterised protein family (UPF0236)